MDSIISALERAAIDDPILRSRLISEKLRAGAEFVEGAIITLDHTKDKKDWSLGWGNYGPAPKKISGRYEIVKLWPDAMTFHRLGKNGKKLKECWKSNLNHLNLPTVRRVLVSVQAPDCDTKSDKKIEPIPKERIAIKSSCRAGPCFQVGYLVRETKTQYVVWFEKNGKPANKRIKKDNYHIEACRSCLCHPQTVYPHGHQD